MRGDTNPSQRGWPRRERGATAVFVALTLLVVGAFLALAINVGHLFSVRHDLQNASDSGALAGALGLDGTAGKLDGAIASGGSYAGYHVSDRDQVVASAVELGHWTPPADACEAGEVATGQTGPNGFRFCRVDARDAAAALRINAARVASGRAAGDPGGGAAPVFMNQLLGAGPTADVRTEAVAVAGGPSEAPCPRMPFVIKDVCFQGPNAIGCNEHLFLGLGSTPVNTAGWTLFTQQAPSSSGLCDYLKNPPTDCSGLAAGTNVQTGTNIGTGNGSNISPMCPPGGQRICDLLKQFEGQDVEVPVVAYGAGNCMSPYSGMASISGFATFHVAQVFCKQHQGDSPAPAGTPCAAFATDQCVAVKYLCQIRSQDPAGGGWYGTTARPRLVR